MHFWVTVFVFLLAWMFWQTIASLVGVPFGFVFALAGALVTTWVIKAWLFAKVQEWHAAVVKSHIDQAKDDK